MYVKHLLKIENYDTMSIFNSPYGTIATVAVHRAAAGSGFEVSISCNFPTVRTAIC